MKAMPRMISLAVLIYFIGLHGVIALAVVKPDRLRRAIGKPSPMIQNMHSIHLRVDEVVPPGFAVFLGDSITKRMPTSAVVPESVNYGISGLTSVDLARHAEHYSALQHASSVFLMIGINDLAGDRQPDYESVLARIPEDIPLVWTGVMHARGISGIEAANVSAKRLCAARPHCIYVHPTTVDSDLDDGVHLTAKGTQKWIDLLRASSPARSAHATQRGSKTAGRATPERP